jgi:hypothetical protein
MGLMADSTNVLPGNYYHPSTSLLIIKIYAWCLEIPHEEGFISFHGNLPEVSKSEMKQLIQIKFTCLWLFVSDTCPTLQFFGRGDFFYYTRARCPFCFKRLLQNTQCRQDVGVWS